MRMLAAARRNRSNSYNSNNQSSGGGSSGGSSGGRSPSTPRIVTSFRPNRTDTSSSSSSIRSSIMRALERARATQNRTVTIVPNTAGR